MGSYGLQKERSTKITSPESHCQPVSVRRNPGLCRSHTVYLENFFTKLKLKISMISQKDSETLGKKLVGIFVGNQEELVNGQFYCWKVLKFEAHNFQI